MWSIWKKRNRRLFEDCESNALQLKSPFLSTLLDWVVSFVPNFSSFCFVDFVNFLDFRPHYGGCFSCILFVYANFSSSLINYYSSKKDWSDEINIRGGFDLMIKVVEMIIKVLSSSCSIYIFFAYRLIPCTKHWVGLAVKFTYPFLYNLFWTY
jgi:hypothetical protein